MIQQGLCTIFKKNCLSGLENFAVGTPYTYNIALYTASANLSSATTEYTTEGEVPNGNGYLNGGISLTVLPPLSDVNSMTAYISFLDAVWDPASFTCRGALIYNSTTNAAVCVLDFGNDKAASGVFTITFPSDTASDAIIRFS